MFEPPRCKYNAVLAVTKDRLSYVFHTQAKRSCRDHSIDFLFKYSPPHHHFLQYFSFLFLFFHFVSCIIFIVMFSSLTAALAFGTVAYALPSAVSPATPFGAVYSALNLSVKVEVACTNTSPVITNDLENNYVVSAQIGQDGLLVCSKKLPSDSDLVLTLAPSVLHKRLLRTGCRC